MTTTGLDQRFAEAMGQLLGPDFPKTVALAVSGGGDSMAMLALAHNWAHVWGVGLHVVTVDHGLRPESATEAEMVARECATLGHPHSTLRWHWDGTGNVQDAARRARLALIDRWRAGIEHVLMAHTADDVAETFLMRLARGSGVEGLSAMQARRRVTPHSGGKAAMAPEDVTQSAAPPLPTRRVAAVPAYSKGFEVIRPCLGLSRAELRHYAKTLQMPWVDDPSNEDPKYHRARARKLLGELDVLGLSAADLTATAQRMQRASVALRARAVSVAETIAHPDRRGTLMLDREGFATVERDTQLRLLAAACMWISGAEYRPRADSLEDLLDRILGGGAGTLIGAKVETTPETVLVYREHNAVRDLMVEYSGQETRWDVNWKISGPLGQGGTIRALGEAIRECPDWRDSGLPRAALMASPAIFDGETLIAAPVAGNNRGWQAFFVPDFRSFLLSH